MSLEEFFYMGGYAWYVWPSFGLALLLMVAEPLLLRMQRHVVLYRIARLLRIRSEETP